MLAKKTSKNQVTLPKKALQGIPETEYFGRNREGRGSHPETGDHDRARIAGGGDPKEDRGSWN